MLKFNNSYTYTVNLLLGFEWRATIIKLLFIIKNKGYYMFYKMEQKSKLLKISILQWKINQTINFSLNLYL